VLPASKLYFPGTQEPRSVNPWWSAREDAQRDPRRRRPDRLMEFISQKGEGSTGRVQVIRRCTLAAVRNRDQ
jgi:hypothetical protein